MKRDCSLWFLNISPDKGDFLVAFTIDSAKSERERDCSLSTRIKRTFLPAPLALFLAPTLRQIHPFNHHISTMNVFKSLGKLIWGDESNPELVQISSGQFYIHKPSRPRECM